ncbi:MAG: ribonuclease H-like domain-containing protein [Lachnospiraceae bacterium]|nr:ribonuclease H-like domain-containing protein [Lachnospiraceae bacterium]
MKSAEYIEKNIASDFPLEKIAEPSRTVFLDIETTGLSPSTSFIYMIGVGVIHNSDIHIKQFLADDINEESLIIKSFIDFIYDHDTIITFNGNKFDIPFLESRALEYGLDTGLSQKAGIDIYKRVKDYRKFFSLVDMKQKTLESFLGIKRDDEMSGKELINVYKEFCIDHDTDRLKLLLLHNHDDILGLPMLLPLLSYPMVLNGNIHAERAVKNNYKDYEGKLRTELIIEFTFEVPVPVNVSAGFSDCYLMLGGNKGKIRVSLYEGTMKFFYNDYKNYYYLPDEDRAIHKSVARYVDQEHRVPARPETCYVKVKGQFLPEWENIVTPTFKNDHKEKTLFFELSDEIKNDPEVFKRYAGHLMKTIISEL